MSKIQNIKSHLIETRNFGTYIIGQNVTVTTKSGHQKGRYKKLKEYYKLIRDKIPEIIEREGLKPDYNVLSEEEYIVALDNKLLEEVKEYQADKSLEEMADVLEVLYAICKARGYTVEELEAKRCEKSEQRGGFDKKLFLNSVSDLADEKKGSLQM